MVTGGGLEAQAAAYEDLEMEREMREDSVQKAEESLGEECIEDSCTPLEVLGL